MSNSEVNIVSGLPRSGTSLMMQMLDAGGLKAVTDKVRAGDDDNPRGYFELEAVKRTKNDPSWLDQVAGRVVKMVHVLLYDLPQDRGYRVLFMKRDLREVVRSQAVMLKRRGTAGANLTDEQLISAYEGQLAKIESWLADQPGFDVLYISYNDLMADPARAAADVNRFLGGSLDEEQMLSHVDPALYRQRA
ncbi:MAG: sulfotransferase domain-containing protein [Planctomycetota bacterium]|jgi:LPS sulfotransferase NodH